MKLSMDGFQPLLIDVRVNLRRGNICVPEHFLDDAQVGAVSEQMRREAVTEKMRINIFLQSGVPGMFFHNLPDTRRC
jgi:hypothetical protein